MEKIYIKAPCFHVFSPFSAYSPPPPPPLTSIMVKGLLKATVSRTAIWRRTPYLLPARQLGEAACLVGGPLEDGVGEGRVAVRADVGVSLLLVSRVTNFWNVVPFAIGDIG